VSSFSLITYHLDTYLALIQCKNH